MYILSNIIEADSCFGVNYSVLKHARHSGIVRKYFRRCIVGKKFKMAAIYPRSNNKLISFSPLKGIFAFFGVYSGVFMYAGHSGIVRKYFQQCIAGKKSKMAAICPRSNNKLIYYSTQ